jgi:CheY-like chemotaxis protein
MAVLRGDRVPGAELATGRATGREPVADQNSPVRVLVADDEPANQRAVALMLERLGHRVDTVDDGEQAVTAILTGDYDLVLMDVQMPHVDGLAATRAARSHRPGNRPRIVAVTAEATDDSRRACLLAGMDDFLSKPVALADLAAALARLPHRVEPAARSGPEPALPAPGPAASALEPAAATRRVLYVDDDESITDLVRRILTKDATVALLTAPDGGTAVQLAVEHRPDIIMLDLHLPDMSGEDLLQRLQADPITRSIPAVVVSGSVTATTVHHLAHLGVADCIAKPFDAATLRAVVAGTKPRATSGLART